MPFGNMLRHRESRTFIYSLSCKINERKSHRFGSRLRDGLFIGNSEIRNYLSYISGRASLHLSRFCELIRSYNSFCSEQVAQIFSSHRHCLYTPKPPRLTGRHSEIIAYR
jgi:hypothetical protein